MSSEPRSHQRFDHFTKALIRLENAVAQPKYNELEEAGLIQTFNFTFELAWKTLRDLLTEEGLVVNTPREVIKHAFQANYIEEGDLWIEALDQKNLMAHVYDEDQSQIAVSLIKQKYFQILKKLAATIQEKITK